MITPAALLAFLVQAACPAGTAPLQLPYLCTAPTMLTIADPLPYRKGDWPGPIPYQIDDSVLLADGQILQTFSYPPFQGFMPDHGDGGDVISRDETTARIDETRDGGQPNDQYFVGVQCHGTGWILVKTDVKIGQWTGLFATLRDSPDPNACPPLVTARTRYREDNIPFPFLINGQRQTLTIDTVTSEHYDGPLVGGSQHMERFEFGKNWGRLSWQAWARQGAAPPDLAQRCPAGPYLTPPAAGWSLMDCRLYTNIQPGNGWLVRDYGWP